MSNTIQWQFQVERCWCGHLVASHVHSLGTGRKAQCVDCSVNGFATHHAFHDFGRYRPKAIVLYANFVGWEDRGPDWHDRFIASARSHETDPYWLGVLAGNEPEPSREVPRSHPSPIPPVANHPARTPYEFPDNVAIDRPARDHVATIAQPGDESKVFIVMHGQYSDQTIDAVFVGNRGAAERYVAEFDRYHGWDEARIEEFEDGATGGGGGLMRTYPDPYTLIAITTHINYYTGAINYNYGQTCLCDDEPNRSKVVTSTSGLGSGKRAAVRIHTQGPDHLIEKIRKVHSDEVARVRAIIIDDPDLLDSIIDAEDPVTTTHTDQEPK